MLQELIHVWRVVMTHWSPLPAGAVRPNGINDILAALNQIKPGQVVVYHEGSLMGERDPRGTPRARNIDIVASHAYEMAMEQKRIDLVQFPASNHPTTHFYAAIGKGANERNRAY